MAQGQSVDEMVGRVRAVLQELRYLSDAPAGKPLDAVKVGNASPGDALADRIDAGESADASLYTKHLSALEDWIVRAEHDRDRQKFRRPDLPRGETPREWRTRLLGQYAGVHDLDVAIQEGCSRAYVRKVRKQAGLRQRDGRPDE